MKHALTIILIVAAFAVVAIHAYTSGLLIGKKPIECRSADPVILRGAK